MGWHFVAPGGLNKIIMRRFWISPEDLFSTSSGNARLDIGHEFKITGDTFHHVVVVSRLRAGDDFELISGQPDIYQMQIVNAEKKSATVTVTGVRHVPPVPEPCIKLALAVPKWPILDAVLEKCVELGVHTVQPLLTEFSAIKKVADYAGNRQERLDKIIQSATVQSARGDLLKLCNPMTFQSFIETTDLNPEARGLMPYEASGLGSDIRSALSAMNLATAKPKAIWALIGSEGGWSSKEVNFAAQKGWQIVTLGPQVLRVETACLATLSVLKYEADLMR
jgi:16S rRNA (uracil1498-N3)-methyltransferase